MKHQNRRHFLLLEVLIAFSLVLLCAFPLLTTQVFIAKAEKQSLHDIEIDRLVNIVLVHIVQDLYNQKPEWKELNEGIEIRLEKEWLDKSSFPKIFPYEVKVHLKLKEEEDTEEETKEDTKYLLQVTIQFVPQDKSQDALRFPYEIFLTRHLLLGQQDVFEQIDQQRTKEEKQKEEGSK